MIERFDEVDVRDQSTGRRVTKQEAHDQDLLHRCVAVFVMAPDSRLYIQNHKKSGLLDHTVGGHVTAGETYETAAYRETEEEIGLRGIQLTRLAVGFYSPEFNRRHMFGIYAVTAPPDWRFAPNDEVDELQLMELPAVIDRMNARPRDFTPGFLNTMQCYIHTQQLPYTLRVSGEHWK